MEQPSNYVKYYGGKRFSIEARRALDLMADFGALRVPFDDQKDASVVKRTNVPDECRRNPDWSESYRATRHGLCTRRNHRERGWLESLPGNGTSKRSDGKKRVSTGRFMAWCIWMIR